LAHQASGHWTVTENLVTPSKRELQKFGRYSSTFFSVKRF